MERICECLERLTEAEVRVANALERLIQMSSTLVADSVRAVAGRENRESPVMAAIRIYAEEGGGNVTEIARRVGCSKSKLYRSPEFQEAKRQVDFRGHGETPRSAVRFDET